MNFPQDLAILSKIRHSINSSVPCYSRGVSLVFLRVVLAAILFAVLAARVLFWLFLCRGKDLCRQPFGIPVEHVY